MTDAALMVRHVETLALGALNSVARCRTLAQAQTQADRAVLLAALLASLQVIERSEP